MWGGIGEEDDLKVSRHGLLLKLHDCCSGVKKPQHSLRWSSYQDRSSCVARVSFVLENESLSLSIWDATPSPGPPILSYANDASSWWSHANQYYVRYVVSPNLRAD